MRSALPLAFLIACTVSNAPQVGAWRAVQAHCLELRVEEGFEFYEDAARHDVEVAQSIVKEATGADICTLNQRVTVVEEATWAGGYRGATDPLTREVFLGRHMTSLVHELLHVVDLGAGRRETEQHLVGDVPFETFYREPLARYMRERRFTAQFP